MRGCRDPAAFRSRVRQVGHEQHLVPRRGVVRRAVGFTGPVPRQDRGRRDAGGFQRRGHARRRRQIAGRAGLIGCWQRRLVVDPHARRGADGHRQSRRPVIHAQQQIGLEFRQLPHVNQRVHVTRLGDREGRGGPSERVSRVANGFGGGVGGRRAGEGQDGEPRRGRRRGRQRGQRLLPAFHFVGPLPLTPAVQLLTDAAQLVPPRGGDEIGQDDLGRGHEARVRDEHVIRGFEFAAGSDEDTPPARHGLAHIVQPQHRRQRADVRLKDIDREKRGQSL